MKFHPLSSKQETPIGNDSISSGQTVEHWIETAALSPKPYRSQSELIRFVGRDKYVLLISNSLHRILWNHRRRLFRSPERRKADVHIHSNLEHLSGIS